MPDAPWPQAYYGKWRSGYTNIQFVSGLSFFMSDEMTRIKCVPIKWVQSGVCRKFIGNTEFGTYIMRHCKNGIRFRSIWGECGIIVLFELFFFFDEIGYSFLYIFFNYFKCFGRRSSGAISRFILKMNTSSTLLLGRRDWLTSIQRPVHIILKLIKTHPDYQTLRLTCFRFGRLF